MDKEKDLESKIVEVFASISPSMTPEQRVEIETRASELAKNNDFRQAAEILKNSESLGKVNFAGQAGWLAALSVAVSGIVVGAIGTIT